MGFNSLKARATLRRQFTFYHYVIEVKSLKGYLQYKMITPQNVLSLAQLKNFFILWKNYVPFLRYSSFCVFSHPVI